jgi:glucose-6-phosphate dehydrogenase assembly protein OpcA
MITPALEHPIRVRPDEVESTLDKLWRDCAPRGLDESTVRLRLLNFVAAGAGTEAVRRFARVAAALPAHHPCRGILAATVADAADVEASISVRCWLAPGGGRHLCSEEITLTAAPGQERALASAVLALLVPEVAVAVWVMGGLADLSLVDEIAEAGDCLYFDSGEAGDPAEAWSRAVAIAGKHGIEPRDLAWSRIATWRALVSQMFDSDEARAELRRLTSITVGSGGGRPSAEALLIAGWLLSRLDLAIADAAAGPEGVQVTLYDGSRGVRLTIATDGGGTALRLLELRGERAKFVVDADTEHAQMHVDETWGDATSRRTVAQPPVDDASLFGAALDGGDHPSVYLDAVDAALALVGREPTEPTGSPR